MPNWCSNSLALEHKDPSMIEKFVKAFEADCVARTFLPPPNWAEIIRQEKLEAMRKDNPQAASLAEKLDIPVDIEKELSQDSRWYDWNVSNWGTKWDFGGSNGAITGRTENSVSAGFDTAWAPPIGVYRALEEQGFTVNALYYEGGMDFGGEYSCGVDNLYNSDVPAHIKEVFESEEDGYLEEENEEE